MQCNVKLEEKQNQQETLLNINILLNSAINNENNNNTDNNTSVQPNIDNSGNTPDKQEHSHVLNKDTINRLIACLFEILVWVASILIAIKIPTDENTDINVYIAILLTIASEFVWLLTNIDRIYKICKTDKNLCIPSVVCGVAIIVSYIIYFAFGCERINQESSYINYIFWFVITSIATIILMGIYCFAKVKE